MLSFQRAATETDRRGRHFYAPTELPKRVHGELSPETVASLRASGKSGQKRIFTELSASLRVVP